MKILLEPKEAEEIFRNALCTGLYELQLNCVEEIVTYDEYQLARKRITEGDKYYEDILLEVLKFTGRLPFNDEYEGRNLDITLDKVHRMGEIVPANIIMDFVNGNDDAFTANSLLQYLLFGEMVYA